MKATTFTVLCAASLWPVLSMATAAVDIPALWDFGRPAVSEQRFRAAAAGAQGDVKLELLTQVARAHGLQRRFVEAHRLLDDIEPQVQKAGPAPRVRYLLERGRTWRSSGTPAKARPLFIAAWDLARASGLDGLAVDAAHMVALVEPDVAAQLDWNERALAVARNSKETSALN